MEILLKIVEYGIVAAVIGFIAFIICGIGKLFFVKRINAKYGIASLQGEEYDKAKAKAREEIQKICNAISVIVGVLLIVPFYIFILEQNTFYQDILFWTNLFAIPSISKLFYLFYQGLQEKNISVKVWLHGLINLIIELFNYLKNLKATKEKSSVSPQGFINALSDIFPLSDEQKTQLLDKLKK